MHICLCIYILNVYFFSKSKYQENILCPFSEVSPVSELHNFSRIHLGKERRVTGWIV